MASSGLPSAGSRESSGHLDQDSESQRALVKAGYDGPTGRQQPTGAGGGGGGQPRKRQLRLLVVVGIMAMQTLLFLSLFALYHWFVTAPHLQELLQSIQDLRSRLQEYGLGEASMGLQPADNKGPFAKITGASALARRWPKMYGQVPEKTIWTYWYDPNSCPSSRSCTLPPALELCVQTVLRNRGSFKYRLLHMDQVTDYVSPYELPVHWSELTAQHQKDALMNALLARYGGVALDISTVLLRPLDENWQEMLNKGATFSGFVYRLNGQPWRHPESLAVWFMMSRREGIFSTAVRNQVIRMGDSNTTLRIFRQPYYALGDQTIFPLLSMFDYNLPKCSADTTLLESATHCPEFEQPQWSSGNAGSARTDTKILLRDPRDGPQLPFATLGMLTWDVHNSTSPVPKPKPPNMPPVDQPGGPMYKESCNSMSDCWNKAFLGRYHTPAPSPGAAPIMSFVKLFSHGAELRSKSRKEILAAKNSYFYNFLKLAGLPEAVG